MESTTQATTAGHPYTKLQFAYDWSGRRIARHVWQGGTQAAPVFKSSHRWLYDGWNVITEFTAPSAASTTLTRANTFTWGLDLSGTLQGAGGVGGLLVQTAVSGGITERASYDGNGNIVAWTKSSASAPTSRREYDAFGNTLVSEGAAPSTFGFSTKMQDTETGLYYYGYRFYDPVTGRWPSRDPIGEWGGLNLYGFVGNDGVGMWDILGLSELGEDQKADHSRPKCKCSITIDVAHGGMRNSFSTERAENRRKKPNKCHRYFSVGCGANKLNKMYGDAQIGLPGTSGNPTPPKPPENDHDDGKGGDSDKLENEGFDRNDLCRAEDLFPHVDKAVKAAEASAPTLCASCNCDEVLLRINCSGSEKNPADILVMEAEIEAKTGRKRSCNTSIKIPCNKVK